MYRYIIYCVALTVVLLYGTCIIGPNNNDSTPLAGEYRMKTICGIPFEKYRAHADSTYGYKGPVKLIFEKGGSSGNYKGWVFMAGIGMKKMQNSVKDGFSVDVHGYYGIGTDFVISHLKFRLNQLSGKMSPYCPYASTIPFPFTAERVIQ